MSDTAITVEGIGKRYRIGAARSGGMYRYKSLRDSLGGLARRPWSPLTNRLRRPGEEETFWALRDVGFEVKRGEVVGIIGRNGAGKSTLLKILSRITKPTEGQIALRGRVGSLLEVGTGFHPELTGRENVYLNGAVLGMARGEVKAKFDEIVAFSEIERFLETPVKQYSSGMYTRLAFAVAAHLEPEILVVDEVLSVGDAEFQRKCIGKMRNVAGQGRTILFVSHNTAAIRDLCDRGLLLERGSLVAVGPTDDIVRRYMSVAVAETEVDARSVSDQKFVGPSRILRCGARQPDGRDVGAFLPELPTQVYADIEGVGGSKLSFGILIRTEWGQDLLHVTSQDETETLTLPGGPSRLTIDLPPLPFNAGRYAVTYYLGDSRYQLQHMLVDAVMFEIDRSHLGNKHARSPVVVSSRWAWQDAGQESTRSRGNPAAAR